MALPSSSTIAPPRTPAIEYAPRASSDDLTKAIEHAAHFLPSQGPLSVFVHHNTLHAFEHLPFAKALLVASEIYGCQPYLAEDRYRSELARGRIRFEDVLHELQEDLGDRADDLIGLLGTRYFIRAAMLQIPIDTAPAAELRWVVAETEALRKFRADAPAESRQRMINGTRRWIMRDCCDRPRAAASVTRSPLERELEDILAAREPGDVDQWSESQWEEFTLRALWRVCFRGAEIGRPRRGASQGVARHREVLLEAAGQDCDELVHEVLIRFCASFLDQGVSHWPLPRRDEGFFRAFLALYGAAGGAAPHWLRGLRTEVNRLAATQSTALQSIGESLTLLGVDAAERESFIAASLVALGGWAGMIWQMETNAEWALHPAPPGSLVEFLAVRLLLDRFAVAHIAEECLNFRGPLCEVRRVARPSAANAAGDLVLRRSFQVFQLAQMLAWSPEELYRLDAATWHRLMEDIDEFSNVERRRIFHLAYERHHRVATYDALESFNRLRLLDGAAFDPPESPLFQFITCLDEREESFRRHLEEVEPRCETFGVAGFFGVAMYYRGVAEAHSRPLCPVIIKPQHYVEEVPAYTFETSHRRRARTRRVLGAGAHSVHRGSRSLLGGAVTALFGSLASIPLVARILFPRLSAEIRRLFSRVVAPPPVTQLVMERSAPEPGPLPGHVGYAVDEMTTIVERVLRDIGLTDRFARIVIFAGHGSSSMNNPHASAYDCGACGGAPGGPNARAFARMANDPRVRERLQPRGLRIPADTYFIGAFHNTGNDAVDYLDLDRLPASHIPLFEQARAAVDQARQRNAHERCRRFVSAPLSMTAEAALRHVEGRCEDMAQVRPECGHATNAVCIVGRRQRTRGLFLDRRAFLASYDPSQDDEECTILTRILGAVIPVCAGINLEYYFSYVDPVRLGCSTKLPHNITALLGVMDGAASDLRPGLPWQMVEIHEPVRLEFIIETAPQKMLKILERNPPLAMLCRNEWVQLAVLDPSSPAIYHFHQGEFAPHVSPEPELPQVASSVEWYRGWRDHLGYAIVAPAPVERPPRAPA